MPTHQINFQNCVIYKIQHLDNEELLYVGHTTDFIRRKYSHKKCCNNPKVKGYEYKLYNMIRENGGWDNFNMVIIHNYPCNTKEEARKEEDKVMRELKANMNTIKAYATSEEQQGYSKEYYLKTREKKLQKSKLWYSENKETSQEYYKDNKEHISKVQKQYRKLNKNRIDNLSIKHRQKYIDKAMIEYEKIKHNKFTCGCGSVFVDRPSNYNNHFKSNKHQSYLKTI